MRTFALLAAGAVAAASFVAAAPLPARANVFCPVTIAAVADLALVGRANTYGVLFDFDSGDATSVRLRVDSATTRYAVDFVVPQPPGPIPTRVRRYFVMPAGEHVASAWVESTGTTPEDRMECPITRPWASNAPPPADPRLRPALDADRRSLLDTFSNQTPTATPKSFGPTSTASCEKPFAPPQALTPIAADTPVAAKAVHASGTVVVRVDLDENSNVVGWQIVRSSGFAPLDQLAIGAAQKATYRTETFECRPVASGYQFAVTFAAS